MTRPADYASSVSRWMDLFDGRSLNGWKFSESGRSWSVNDGAIVCRGPAATLTLARAERRVLPRNFELELEVMARPGSRAEVSLSSPREETSVRILIANSASVPDNPDTWMQAGSLLGRRHVYKKLVADNGWADVRIAVRGRHVQVRVNGMLLVDFFEQDDWGQDIENTTLALHWPGGESEVLIRRIRLVEIAGATAENSSSSDEIDRQIVRCTARGIPVIDFHVHLKGGLTVEDTLRQSRQHGIEYGIAVNCGKGFPVETDAAALAFFEEMKQQPVFVGMQAEGREWMSMFSRETAAGFDYIFTDAMTWSDQSGRRMRLWIADEVGAIGDPDDFMETLVARSENILLREPIDIFANPTFLPAVLADAYDQLWTEHRMLRLIEAAARNHVAIELNELYQLPSARFIRLAKQNGCKFTLGSNNTSAADLRRSEYGLRMIDHCGLEPRDFYIPDVTLARAMKRNSAAF